MKLKSTRSEELSVIASEAMLRGIAPDGGLFVPEYFPEIKDIDRYTGIPYPKICADILRLFFDDIAGLDEIAKSAYSRFDDERVAPLKKIDDGEYVLELWHGPTLAFKDMALSVLPRLMTAAMSGDKDILILVATSGDTGKAALEGFCNVGHIKIIVFYPEEGVSDMQRLQMVTQEGDNTKVIAVKGNFDDAQNGVKSIFTDAEFAKVLDKNGFVLSSANSINFGRLAPQIAYYFWSYVELLKSGDIKNGEKINFAVPTGNFGNILAAYYAKRMGLPVNKLICASNKNNVLTDFFNQGEYSLKREFYRTMSPSMDILISSNLERLLFEITGRDTDEVKELMKRLKGEGAYAIEGEARMVLDKDFFADWCGEEQTMKCIKDTFEKKGYLLDTHTAVAAAVYDKYKINGDDTKTVIVSTASPYKFPGDVLSSLGEDIAGMTSFDMAEKIAEVTGTNVPQQIRELKSKSVRHNASVEKNKMRKAVLEAI